jgi:hypothetical protein
MIINLHIYEVPAVEMSSGYFLGESSQLCINSNIRELAGEPIEFYGDSRQSVIDQVKKYARAKFGSGSIRLK